MSPRYRFGEFTLSPSRRLLLRSGSEVPLIPRYFDLLVLLIERRHQAVQRQEILDEVWSDVVVTDGSLSQAIRTLRRALGDTAREPLFIRTVSRHGYHFVFPAVAEEMDGPTPEPAGATATPPAAPAQTETVRSDPEPVDEVDPIEAALRRLLEIPPAPSAADDDRRREAAETLHALGTAETLRRLDERPGQARARALLRDARWDVPGAGAVPLLGQPGAPAAILALLSLRLRRAARQVAERWGSAAAGGALAGAFVGLLGGYVLASGPGSSAPASLPLALLVLGLVAGGTGAGGIGAGLAFAEAVARSMRGPALVSCGAASGALTASAVHLIARATVAGLFGHDLPSFLGGFEGLVIGGSVGFGYAVSTPGLLGGGMATPRGPARLRAALLSGLCCAVACAVVCRFGGNFAGTSLHLLARAYQGSHVGLAPLARLLGEVDPGLLTRTVSAGIEGLFFGAGLVAGLTHRPR